MNIFRYLKNLFRKNQSINIKPSDSEKLKIETKIAEIVVQELHDNRKNYPNLMKFNSDNLYWGAVVKAICFAESGFNPYETFFENTMGYYSEGLMQLSHSDRLYYHCKFDPSDRDKMLNDKTKTIFDIETNVLCGLSILENAVKRKGHYIFEKNQYWAVLKPANKRHRVFLEKFESYNKEGMFQE